METAEKLARTYHSDPAFADYARAYDALLASSGVTGYHSMVEAGPHRAFVLEFGRGAPVLFIHGSPATSAVWAPLLGKLDGVQAFAIDRPGHGLSDAFDYANVTDLRSHAVGFLESMLDALRLDRVTVAGSSLGGLWAWWLALDRPHRVSRVVQLGLPPGMQTDRLPFIFGLLSVPWVARLMRRLDPPSPASTRRLFKLMGDPPASLSDALVDAFTLGQQLPTAQGGIAHLVQKFVRFPGRFDGRLPVSAEELARITQPVLLLAGGNDFLGGLDYARRAFAPVPHAKIVPVGAGHLPWLQDPQGTAKSLSAFTGTPEGGF